MHKLSCLIFMLFISHIAFCEPIQQNSQNPHYFEYKGEPCILITSAEHYGAVVNLDFDYELYLQTLHKAGLNYTRIFTGTYVEKPGAFGIGNNTLAPEPNRFIAPWARSSECCYANGGNKFDLEKWNPDYFKRIKNFLSLADKYDIIVEVTLFSSIYADSNWEINPFHPNNNINQIKIDDRLKVHTLDNGKILRYQLAFVRKIVKELNDFDNIFFEIQNEPYGDLKDIAIGLNPNNENWREDWEGRVDLAPRSSLLWQDRMIDTIREVEHALPKQHLIGQNICNFYYPIKSFNPYAKVLNFHYAWPEAVSLNYGLRHIIGFDESGFSGDKASTYRQQAWKFILSGGGLYNNLDYSFTVDHEDGTHQNDAPGLSDPAFHQQMKVLKDFMYSFDFINMQPSTDFINLAPGLLRYGMVKPGKEYAVYLTGRSENAFLRVSLPEGKYKAEWISTLDGKVINESTIESDGRMEKSLVCPPFDTDVAVRIVRDDK